MARRGSFQTSAPAPRLAAVKLLLLGSGGREHALAWRLAQSPRLDELHAAPGNPGIAALGDCHPVRAEDAEAVVELARSLAVDLVVVGPEAPLVAGVADELRHGGIAVFGPSADAARIEGSKSFAKEIMRAAGVAAAATMPVARPPCVVKADGLASGKGVHVCRTEQELEAGLRATAALGGPVVIEELLEGEEVSVFALTDGARTIALPVAQDFKRIGDGDTGPNTGGMGAYAPVDGVDPEELLDLVHRPVLDELARRGTPFVGALFAGLMLTEDGPRVLEFNCRFGDPETQSVLPILEDDLLEALVAAATGDLSGIELRASDRAAVTVVLAAGSYPEGRDAGSPIEGIEEAEREGALVFQAGTAVRDGRLVTNGGRILSVTATGDSVPDARSGVYAAVERISFPGARYRRDVAAERGQRVGG
ncbi:MAG: phosphoribosylamine--glycine ligase [Actinobacteria bacterium]|nr:MAG: phosphoribosylamine--glycine ligase [Actinomycetota bacterium]